MVDAYASAFAHGGARRGRPYVGLRSCARSHVENVSWGAWDQARERWAERPLYDLEFAERIAGSLNEAYAAGLTDTVIGIARRRPRRRSTR